MHLASRPHLTLLLYNNCISLLYLSHCRCYTDKDAWLQVPRQAAEEAKEAVVAPAAPAAAAAAAAAIGDGLDMFADNVDADMFAEDPVVPVGAAPAKKALLDNYDDVEGYYNFQVGVLLLFLSEAASV